MPTVADVDRLYGYCDGLVLVAEQYDHELFAAFSGLVNEFRWAAQAVELDEEWERLLARMRRYRYFAASTPLPFNHPALLGRLDLGEARRLVAIGRQVYPSVAEVAGQALGRLDELVERGEESPLLEPVVKWLEGDQVMLALTDRKMVEAVVAEIAKAQPAANVVPASMLARAVRCERVVLAGDRRSYPEQVFAAPRAREITIVAYEWQHVNWEPGETLTGKVSGRTVILQAAPGPSRPRRLTPVIDDDPGGLFEAASFARAMQREAERAEFTEYDLVEARLYRLAGGQGVYLAAGEERTLVVDPYSPPKQRLARLKDEELEAGMFVVLRTGRSGDAVAQIANQILGLRGIKLGDEQLRWKSALRGRLAMTGIDAARCQLAAAGVGTATNLNIRNWASHVVIAPGSARDFAQVLAFCGLEQETERLWAGAEEIRNARRRAGRKIREALEEQLEQVDREKLTEDGEEVLALAEYPQVSLGAYQVVWRSPEKTLINGAELGRVIDLGD